MTVSFFINLKDDGNRKADQLIADAAANVFDHAGERDPEMILEEGFLAPYLHNALSFLLGDFDYDAQPNSGQGQAARILASIIVVLNENARGKRGKR